MGKKFLLLFVAILFVFVLTFLSCGKKDESPTKPEENPNVIPDYNVSVELFFPSFVSGQKSYAITFDTDKYISNGVYLSITGTCNSVNSVSRTVKVQQGNYYIHGFVDVDESTVTAISIGDYIGIYGGTWPGSIPSNANAAVYSDSYFGVTLSTIAIANMGGTITFPKELDADYTMYVVCDRDLNTANGAESIFTIIVPYDTLNIKYSMIVPGSGDYFLYAFVDRAGNGYPPEERDILGYYDSVMPQLTPPGAVNVNINITTDNMYDIQTGSIPTSTFTTPPTSTYTYTPTNTYTPTSTPTATQTFTPTCGTDQYEPDNDFASAKLIYFLLPGGATSSQIYSISGVGDNDYIKIGIDNMDIVSHTFDLLIQTKPGDIGADTELTLYDASYNQIAYDDNGGSGGTYSQTSYNIVLPAFYGSCFYVKVNEKGNNNEICSYILDISLENMQ